MERANWEIYVRVLLRILGYLGRYKWLVILAYVSMFIGLGSMLLVPRLIQYVIDDGIAGNDDRVLLLGALFILLAAVGQGVFTYVRSYLFQALAERVGTDLRGEYYQHLQTLPFSYYDRAQSGQLMSRGAEDINSIRRFMMFSLRMGVYSAMMLVIITVILFSLHARLAALSLAVMPPLIFTAIHLGRTIRPMFNRVQQQFGEMTTVLQENLSGARVVRVFAQEDREVRKFDRSLTELFDRQMTAISTWALYFPAMSLLSHLGLAIILWYGGRQVLNGTISIGTLVAFNIYLTMLAMPVQSLGFIVNSMMRAVASADRIFEVIDTQPTIKDREGAIELVDPVGEVNFENVSFTYPGTAEPVLHDINFTARPNQVIAIIGSTGAGKSTITSLIPRFYDVTSGRVLIDGVDVRDYTLLSLRRNVAHVMQETFLFSSSIRDNIAYGRPDATDEEIVEATKIARAHEFISEMPDGYMSVLGERGLSLSGGQKQRLAIARALCSDPKILILDDATSSVDTETEYEIQMALKNSIGGRTTFVIAQRLSAVKAADEILVVDDGRIVERGQHDDLLSMEGFYARIYDLQLKDQEEFLQIAD
jgi:ATP-binding cassette, subfamily B, multidrug efflux pump